MAIDFGQGTEVDNVALEPLYLFVLKKTKHTEFCFFLSLSFTPWDLEKGSGQEWSPTAGEPKEVKA